MVNYIPSPTDRANGFVPTGALREPIVLMRSERTPDADTGYLQTFTKYGNSWAAFNEREVSWLNGAQCDPFMAHRFYMRHNDQLRIERRDVIIWGRRVFLVSYTKILDKYRRFIRVDAKEYVGLDSPNMSDPNKVTFKMAPPAATENPQTESTTNPYWGD